MLWLNLLMGEEKFKLPNLLPQVLFRDAPYMSLFKQGLLLLIQTLPESGFLPPWMIQSHNREHR